MKSLRRIIFLILVVVFAILPLSGCNDNRAATAEELIPNSDELGAPDGLWLYKDSFRYRTDGTEVECLFHSISAYGATYARDRIHVDEYVYDTDSHKAMFSVIFDCEKNESKRGLYLFDYENKTGKYLCDVPYERVTLVESDGLFVAAFYDDCNGDDRLVCEYLFDSDGNLLCDDIRGTFQDGILYELHDVRLDDGTKYLRVDWYYNGRHALNIPGSIGSSFDMETHGDWMYFIDVGNEPIFAIEKNTEEYSLFDDAFDIKRNTSKYVEEYRHIENRFYYNDSMYVFSVVYRIIDRGDENREGKDEWWWYLHRIDGGTAKEECSFGEYRSGATLGVYKDKIYFNGMKYSWIVQRKFRYDPVTRKTKKISVLSYHKGYIPALPSNKPSSGNKIVGEYEFYVSSRAYGYSGFLTAPMGHCYYLMRKHDGKTEIMQYTFDYIEAHFYDDICEF